MEIQKFRIDDLTPAPYNPRKDLTPEDAQYKKIRRSIQEFGCVEPVIWNKTTKHLVSGHQRAKVLKDLGETEIEAVVIEATAREEKKLNVLLNRARGRWDDQKLSELIQELDEKGAVELTGFDEWELQGILESYDHLEDILDYQPPEPEDDTEPEDQEPQMFSMTFAIPAEYADLTQQFLDTVEDAEMELATAVINMIKEAG
ncbi:MAG: ParB N-terminal domain-containing protein [Oscillospiraceae bacterium]|nr:ParB N-terminal domain-containing protein [Oscillospiraceae bacterium]